MFCLFKRFKINSKTFPNQYITIFKRQLSEHINNKYIIFSADEIIRNGGVYTIKLDLMYFKQLNYYNTF